MKKNTLSLILGSVLAAFAVSSFAADVQLYGKVDTQLHYAHTKTGKGVKTDKFEMTDGSSRFGINAREKLSDDVTVKVYLENGFKADSGEFMVNNTLWNRRAILAVNSQKYGELAFGRMGGVDTIFGPYGQGIGSLCTFLTGYGPDFSLDGMFASETTQMSNAVSYISPKINGFKAAFTYSFAMDAQENEHTNRNNRDLSGYVSYDIGDLHLVLGGAEIFSAKSDTLDRKDQTQIFAGATYKILPNVQIHGAVQTMKDWRNLFYSGWMADVYGIEGGMDGQAYMLGIRYNPTANQALIASAMLFDGDFDDRNGVKQDAQRQRINLGYEYKFSKRTMAYAVAGYTKNKDALVDATGRTPYESEFTAYAGLQIWF